MCGGCIRIHVGIGGYDVCVRVCIQKAYRLIDMGCVF